MSERPLALLCFSGDLSTKARVTRLRFRHRLLANLRDALESEGLPPAVRGSHDRVYAELPDDASAEVLTRVFGVQSVSRVERRVETRLDDVVRSGVELFGERVRGRRFAVRARRVGNRERIGLAAREVEHALGAALLPHSAGVDLDAPEVTVRIELHEDGAYFFAARLAGPGGLPLGVEGRAVALVSGGFDSAVAAWQLQRRGVALDYVFCNLGGVTHERGVLRVVKVLADRWSYGDRPRLYAIDFEPLAAEIRERTETRYWQVLLKRLMLRAAERVARERGAEAIVTGEAVGQVSSQTLRNLAVISGATRMPILRPLVGFNKEEIIELAQRIETYELSKVVGEYCAMVPRRPATAATERAVEAQEAQLDPERLASLLAARTRTDLRELDLDKLELPELEVDWPPEGAVVIDLRSKGEYRSWHPPEALRLDFAQAMRAWPSFDRRKSYVFYCEFGLKSAHLAEQMRRAGFDAYHVKRGVRTLRRLAEGA